MSGRRIDQLPWPPRPCHRVDLLDRTFESAQAAIAEDARRARLIRKTVAGTASRWAKVALTLADRLDPQTSSEPPRSLASSRYMRDQRTRFTGAQLKLVEAVGVENVARVDITKPGLTRDLEGLLNETPARAMNELRTDLIRAGMSNCEGFVVGAYHNEFDPLHQTFQGHGHFLVGGEYIPALENLRKFKAYKRTEWVRRPILVNRRLINLPHALSYILKSYWLSRPKLPLGANGGSKRPRMGQRIPEPYHTQVLMWLDQFQLSDLCLLMGVSIRKSGLEAKW